MPGPREQGWGMNIYNIYIYTIYIYMQYNIIYIYIHMYFECNKDRDVEGSSWKPKTSKDHVYASELVDGLICESEHISGSFGTP